MMYGEVGFLNLGCPKIMYILAIHGCSCCISPCLTIAIPNILIYGLWKRKLRFIFEWGTLGSHEQSTWSIFMCYNLSTSHQLEYISRFSRALSGRGSVGFTTVIAGTESISDWDASPTGCDWPRPPNFCFFPNTLDTLEFSGYSSLSPFRLLYIYIYIYVNMHSPMSGQTCHIWYHHIHIQIRIKCIWINTCVFINIRINIYIYTIYTCIYNTFDFSTFDI